MLDLAIIIVNFNTCDYLRNCLTSIYDSRGDFSFEVCVVDNASSDGSADMVRAAFPQARLIESPVNGGFSYANNLGLSAYGFGALTERAQNDTDSSSPGESSGTPGYALLLNPDTLLPPEGLAITRMQVWPDPSWCSKMGVWTWPAGAASRRPRWPCTG
jgi:GT2 family glycosyltransferase